MKTVICPFYIAVMHHHYSINTLHVKMFFVEGWLVPPFPLAINNLKLMDVDEIIIVLMVFIPSLQVGFAYFFHAD